MEVYRLDGAALIDHVQKSIPSVFIRDCQALEHHYGMHVLSKHRIYVAHYNLCRVHESLRSTPAMALGITDRVWTIGDLIDAALATQPITPVTTAPDRRKRFRVIDGGRE